MIQEALIIPTTVGGFQEALIIPTAVGGFQEALVIPTTVGGFPLRGGFPGSAWPGYSF